MPKIFSHSRLSTFEQCRLKYKFRYIDKIIPEIEKTIEAHLGTSVHSALEWLYHNVKEGAIPSVEEVIRYYTNVWKDEYHEDIAVVRKDKTVEDYFNRGIQFLLNYYMEHHPFDDNTVSIEEEVIFDLDENGNYKIRGFIDRLVYNFETGEYEVHDYKTSNSLPSQDTIEKDRQLALYSIAIKEKYGKEKKVRLVWHYLSFNKKLQSDRTDEQLHRLKNDTLELVKEIDNTSEFPPTKSTLCDWCEYKPICPAWGNKPPEKQTKLGGYIKIEGENGDKLDMFK